MTRRHRLTTLLVAGSLSGTLFAAHPLQDDARVAGAAQRLLAQRQTLGLGAEDGFMPHSSRVDELGMAHVAFQQTYKGVRVFGGEIITHMARTGAELPHTSALKAGISLNVTPSIDRSEALAIAHRDMAPRAAYKTSPQAELVVYPELALGRVHSGEDATAFEYQPVRYHLAYVISAQVESEAQTAHMKYVVDAHTGAILAQWDDLHSSAATGTGNSQYSGAVSLNTNNNGSAYELLDTTRGNTIVAGSTAGNAVTNLNHGTSGTGTLYTDADNSWGDGANYVEGAGELGTTSANGQTAAVDAAYGIASTWDMYKNVLGRDGIDGSGTSSYLRVHYSNTYDNAFWDDTCFCMTFGDGSSFLTLTSVDVAGHEMSHGVCANSVPGGLTYSGESGGLNESNSDVMGTMVEFYDLGGGTASGSTTVPTTGGNWTIGEQLETASFNHPLRYMYKPSLDGTSPDAWSKTLKNLNVHYSSGPGNREFYFLSQGSSSNSGSNDYSSYLTGGMTGVGNDHATRIHYRALTTYYTSSETYAQARAAHISAAQDLYGAGSYEEAAVWNSFAAINVGLAWSDATAPSAATVTESGASGTITLGATATDDKGIAKVEWSIDGSLVGSSQTAPYAMTYDSTLLTDGSHTVTVKAYDAANNSITSAGLPFSVDNTAPAASGSVAGSMGTITFTGTATDSVGVTKVEFYVDGALKGNDTSSPFSLAFNSATLADGAHSLVVKAYDAANNVGTSSPVSFTTDNTAPSGVSLSETGTSGTITLNASATDNVGVQRVQFYIDNIGRGTDYSAPYVLHLDSAAKLSDGNHIAYVAAFDAAGNRKSSSSILFKTSNTADTTKPVLSNLAVSGTTGTITFSATATDDVSANLSVGFYIDGVGKGTDYFAPYGMAFDSTKLANGSHTLMVKATDAAGNWITATVPFTTSN